MVKEGVRHPERPLAIAKVASRLFSEKGYLETTMSNIVAAGNASKGAIYHYFSCKEEILFAIVDGYMDLVLDNLESRVGELTTPEDQIEYVIRRHVNLYATHMDESKVLLRESRNLPPGKYAVVAAKERRYYDIVSKILSTYLGPETDPRYLPPIAFTLFGMMNWVYSWYDPDKEVSPGELADLIFRIFTEGLGRSSRPSVR